MLINDAYYKPYSYYNNPETKIKNIYQIDPLLLISAVFHFIKTIKPDDQKSKILKQVMISVDKFDKDKICIFVQTENDFIPFYEYLNNNKLLDKNLYYLSKHFKYVLINTVSAFDFDIDEFNKRAIIHYSGLPHAWPMHTSLKENFPTYPEWQQKDLGHCMIDYLTTHKDLGPNIQEKNNAYNWLKSMRKYKMLIILGIKLPELNYSILVYDKKKRQNIIEKYSINDIEINKLIDEIKYLYELILIMNNNLIIEIVKYHKELINELYNYYKQFKPSQFFKILLYPSDKERHYKFLKKCIFIGEEIYNSFDNIKKNNDGFKNKNYDIIMQKGLKLEKYSKNNLFQFW